MRVNPRSSQEDINDIVCLEAWKTVVIGGRGECARSRSFTSNCDSRFLKGLPINVVPFQTKFNPISSITPALRYNLTVVFVLSFQSYYKAFDLTKNSSLVIRATIL